MDKTPTASSNGGAGGANANANANVNATPMRSYNEGDLMNKLPRVQQMMRRLLDCEVGVVQLESLFDP